MTFIQPLTMKQAQDHEFCLGKSYGVGALALFGALAYAAWSDHTRNRANDQITEQATHELRAS